MSESQEYIIKIKQSEIEEFNRNMNVIKRLIEDEGTEVSCALDDVLNLLESKIPKQVIAKSEIVYTFDCPNCDQEIRNDKNYNSIWWNYYDIISRKDIECNSCGQPLIISYEGIVHP